MAAQSRIPRSDVAVAPMTAEERKVILASSVGTVFEWYDFYLYGSLAVIIGAKFFSQFDESTRNIFALLAFAAGFLVRPFGALVFGRLGDLVGRKYTFLITILIMGASTFIVGLMPTSDQIGLLAPVVLIALRMAQGLALGGEYGGAATYVAEHAPHGRRGFYTSWIQTTATGGLFLSLLVILLTQAWTGSDFAVWGWRVPFLVSILLLGVSVWIRLQLSESPAFLKMKAEGTHSKAPLSEAFGQWKNAKVALLALLGLVAGQAVVWYTGQFYALFFLISVLKVDGFSANLMVAWSLLLGTGGFVLFGALSDRIGRKPIILGGCLLAAILYFPLFTLMTDYANPALAKAHETVKAVVIADPNDCSFQFNPTGTSTFTNSCDIAKGALARASVTYSFQPAPAGTIASIKIDGTTVPAYDVRKAGAQLKDVAAAFNKGLADALTAVGYPAASNPSVVKLAHPFDVFRVQPAVIVLILTVLVILVTMVYGPIAAALVELFPTRIRYTSMSLPYHIGNGWFGGLLPATAFAMIAQTGDIYYGLWYPIVIALITVVVGFFFVPETKDRDIFAADAVEAPHARPASAQI
ncbi:MFS transporter [Limobrevibacterium gyesilva]|uniref:MFS transporter n=1 Tax=Limobrevibacterium gyesilva TaxID=2991712 RepID=A0AA41YQM7_9PROT|nr:MFS transporter [Limobrevibacterium gyesilva]MCW3477075.1 MFS transporter [Limobrevibacterium gyesilva]